MKQAKTVDVDGARAQQKHDDAIVAIVQANLRRVLTEAGFPDNDVEGILVGKMGSRVYLNRTN